MFNLLIIYHLSGRTVQRQFCLSCGAKVDKIPFHCKKSITFYYTITHFAGKDNVFIPIYKKNDDKTPLTNISTGDAKLN